MIKKYFLNALFFFVTISLSANDLTRYALPMVGTDFTGHTFPGATYPFGMVQLSPDTGIFGWEVCSGYHYEHREILGFSHTHLSGTGCEDYCDILLMPVMNYNFDSIHNEHYKSAFKHSNEIASPGYYKVLLDKHNIEVELTAGQRVGMHRYTFNDEGKPQIIIDLTHRDILLDADLMIVNNRTIQGFRRSKSWAKNQYLAFYLEFSEPFIESKLESGKTEDGKNVPAKLLLTFKNAKRGKKIQAKIAISSVSPANAKVNLTSEVRRWEFDQICKSTKEAWNDYLSKIEITTNDTEEKEIFYTAMYHTAIAPNIYSDVNGEYRGMDDEIHKANGYTHYTVFSLWDTYRALHPLFTIIERERTKDFLLSFLDIFDQSGKLPIWELSSNETDCMIGYHSISVIADAFAKGIDGVDYKRLLNAMVASSSRDDHGSDVYRNNGLILAEKEHESVSKTLEYAYDDWCVAMVAKALGQEDIYNEYLKRSQYYKNIFDPNTGFMTPRLWGSWIRPFNPTEVNNHFTEANSWQYSFYVPHDVNTHIDLLGGDEAYTAKLEELFTTSEGTTGRQQSDITGLIGQYAHGNEPSHHAAYLYAYSGVHWRAQEIIRNILTNLYTSRPDGLCGNDDCGQMSAWYVLSAIGFYPVLPGSNQYVIGSPMYEKTVINLENGKQFTINAPRGREPYRMLYIDNITINNKPYSKSWFTHDIITDGSTMNFTLSSTPNIEFGKKMIDRPYSRIPSEPIVINPYFVFDNTIFKDTLTVEIKAFTPSYKLMYRVIDEANIIEEEKYKYDLYQEYSTPFTFTENKTLYSYAVNDKGEKSFVTASKFHKINQNMKIELLSKYNRQYTAGGDEGLIDGVRGERNFRLGGWQGYQDTDFTAIVDLQDIKDIHLVGAGFLQDAKSWIWMPEYVEFYVSEDGENFTFIGRVSHEIDERDLTPAIIDLSIDTPELKGRYIKVFAKNFGTIPDWHLGAGGEGFIFIDEIFVK